MPTPCSRRVRLPIAMVSIVIALGCDSASAVSMTTAPTAAAKCQPQLAGASTVAASGGSGAVNITTQPECEWSATSAAGWITDLTPPAGQGSAQVSFRVTPNATPSTRTGEIAVNDGRIQVVQEGAPCTFDVRPGNLAISPAGGTISASVSAMNGCTWSASVNVSWIAVTAGERGNGDGAATFRVTANTGSLRTANIVVAGRTYRVTQDASGSAKRPAPAPSPKPGGGDEDEGGGGKGKGKDKDKDNNKGKDLLPEVTT